MGSDESEEEKKKKWKKIKSSLLLCGWIPVHPLSSFPDKKKGCDYFFFSFFCDSLTGSIDFIDIYDFVTTIFYFFLFFSFIIVGFFFFLWYFILHTMCVCVCIYTINFLCTRHTPQWSFNSIPKTPPANCIYTILFFLFNQDPLYNFFIHFFFLVYLQSTLHLLINNWLVRMIFFFISYHHSFFIYKKKKDDQLIFGDSIFICLFLFGNVILFFFIWRQF